MVKLSDVDPDGRSMLVTEGVTRIAKRGGQVGLEPVTPGEIVSLEVLLSQVPNLASSTRAAESKV